MEIQFISEGIDQVVMPYGLYTTDCYNHGGYNLGSNTYTACMDFDLFILRTQSHLTITQKGYVV